MRRRRGTGEEPAAAAGWEYHVEMLARVVEASPAIWRPLLLVPFSTSQVGVVQGQ